MKILICLIILSSALALANEVKIDTQVVAQAMAILEEKVVPDRSPAAEEKSFDLEKKPIDLPPKP